MTEREIIQQYQAVCAQTRRYYAKRMQEARAERKAQVWVALIKACNQYLAWARGQCDAQLALLRGEKCQ